MGLVVCFAGLALVLAATFRVPVEEFRESQRKKYTLVAIGAALLFAGVGIAKITGELRNPVLQLPVTDVS